MSQTSTHEKESIFREKAYRLYKENRQKIVVLRLAQPGLFPWIWILLVGLGVLVGLTWVAEIPVTVEGSGLITSSDADTKTLVVLMAGSSLDRLAPEQRLLVYGGQDDTGTRPPLAEARLVEVERVPAGDDSLRQRFAQHLSEGTGLVGSLAVVTARFEEQRTIADLDEPLLRIEAEVAQQRVLSLLPGFESRSGT